MDSTDWRHADAVVDAPGPDARATSAAGFSPDASDDDRRDDSARGDAPVEGATSLLARMERDGEEFDFFQAVWLLETLFRRAGARDPLSFRDGEPQVRIRPREDLVFPPSDVYAIRRTETASTGTESAELVATFMGLYGVDSPLPVYFPRTVADTSEEAHALRDFLDVFNHRLYTLFYETWKKYRPALDFEADASDEAAGRPAASGHARAFVSLAGLGSDDVNPRLPGGDALPWASLAGRLGGHVRNAEGLAVLLSHALDGIPATIEENVPRWTRIRERHTLGTASVKPAALCRHAVVGPRVYDVANKFRVVLGPLTIEQFRALQPGEPLAKRVQSTVDLYVPDLLDYDVELRLDPDELQPATLCDPGTRLGRTAWLRRPQGQAVSEVVTYGEERTGHAGQGLGEE